MTYRQTILGIFVGGCLTLPTSNGTSAQPPAPEPPVPYDALTDTKVEVANFLPEPFSGIDVGSDGAVWFLNPYASQFGKYTALTDAPDLLADTGLNPVSIAVWEPTTLPEDRKIVIVCRGTHGVFLHNSETGEIENFLLLDSEPADLVIDPDNDWAFISCQGDNTVVQVDLTKFSIDQRFHPPVGERPGSLYLDRDDTGIDTDNRVYVAMAVTGNNSIPVGPTGVLGSVLGIKGFIFDLDGLVQTSQLLDQDVFRLNPFTGSVSPAIRGAGSLLFDIARNPVTQDMWVLSSFSNNKDLTLITEPDIRGNIVVNQLQVLSGVVTAAQPVQAPSMGIDLDDTIPATPDLDYDATRSINQARTFDFLVDPELLPGFAFMASAQSDVMISLDTNGNRIIDFALPTGAQCYTIEAWDPDERIILALCLGTMTIEVFNWATSTAPIASLRAPDMALH